MPSFYKIKTSPYLINQGKVFMSRMQYALSSNIIRTALKIGCACAAITFFDNVLHGIVSGEGTGSERVINSGKAALMSFLWCGSLAGAFSVLSCDDETFERILCGDIHMLSEGFE